MKFESQTSTEGILLDDFLTLYMISNVKSHSYKGCSIFYALSKSEGIFSIEAIRGPKVGVVLKDFTRVVAIILNTLNAKMAHSKPAPYLKIKFCREFFSNVLTAKDEDHGEN